MFPNEHPMFKAHPDKHSKANPDKQDKGTFKVTPNSSAQGRAIGSTGNKKGVKSKASVIKHDGIVMGGSVTNQRKSASQKSINKLASGGKTRVVGEG